ncbi:MAG: hypothetical protein AVDCRST_MAG89-3711, partial [uncultured Gemmatimonadetes bacterium]
DRSYTGCHLLGWGARYVSRGAGFRCDGIRRDDPARQLQTRGVPDAAPRRGRCRQHRGCGDPRRVRVHRPLRCGDWRRVLRRGELLRG